MQKLTIYIIYISIFIISSFALFFAPTGEIFRGFMSLPGVASLLLVMNELWKEGRAHERAIELRVKEQDFALGTASHMAKVVYDKHVDFCEEYVGRVQKGLQELFRDGPSKNILNIGSDLVGIRQKHSPWLTKEMEDNLKPFEKALIDIGAKEHLLDSLPVGEQRNKVVSQVYKSFGLVLGHDAPETKEEAELAIDKVVEKIRGILGTSTFTSLRIRAAELATERLKK